MADCVLPEEIMLCILTRLPVESILRFKSVCKHWRELFSSQEFMKLHYGQFSSDPKNLSFIVRRFDVWSIDPRNQFSIFNIESSVKKPTVLDFPFAYTQNIELDIVGCCNGLVCIRRGHGIILWNPSVKLSKEFPPLEECGIDEMVSLGFGYDAVGADFMLVRIVGSRNYVTGKGITVTSVEVYSFNSDSCTTINVGFRFSVIGTKRGCPIVNGNPHWVAEVDENEVLVCFDVMELVFKIVPMPTLYWNALVDGCDEEAETWEEAETGANLVDWNGSLGAILYTINYEFVQKLGDQGLVETTENKRVESVCVLVFDDVKRIWRTVFTFASRIEVDLDSFLLCTKNGKFLGKCRNGELFVFDLETGCVEVLLDVPPLMCSPEVYGYIESLAYIKGMEKVVVKNERQDLDD